MQILSVQNYSFRMPESPVNKYNKGSYIRHAGVDSFHKSAENVSFGAITTSSLIKTVEEFKELPRNRVVHCFYCQIPMFSPGFVKDLMKRGIFDGDIADFIAEIAPYKSYLKPTPAKIFEYFEKVAKVAPQTHLSRALKSLSQEALAALREKQLPIYEKLEAEISKLPADLRKELQPILIKHKNRIQGLAQIEDFSPKDFSYKIKKISKRVVENTYSSLLSNYAETMLNTVSLTNSTLHERNIINKTFHKNDLQNSKLPINLQSIQLYIVEQIKKTGLKLGNSDIITVCRQAEKMLTGKPVRIKFSNKTLSHDIDKILQEKANEKQRKRILRLIEKLPKSATSMDSFIAKHEFSSSSTIGYEVLLPSIDTLEHMKPRATHALNVETLGNYALACGGCNNKRGDGYMALYLKKYPQTSPQVYFNDIIGAVNDGFISLEDLLRMKETIYVQGSKQMNIQKIASKVLRTNFGGEDGQKNFDRFVELANENLISGRDLYALQQMLRQRCGIAVKIENFKSQFY